MRSYNSFKEFFKNEKIDVRREVESVIHRDENIANNRMFVWNFEQEDLSELIEYFQIYKSGAISIASRQLLNANLMRKMSSMLREGYNPVECMLYASKVINMKLSNDKELQEVLAERIKDIYIKQEDETREVLKNIIRMWTWIPQLYVIIAAIGLIGDDQELLDSIMVNYSEDPNYKGKVFYALMQNKSIQNLERAMRIIMNLQDTENDNMLGRAFIREISGFGYEGNKLVSKYFGNPGMSRVGGRIIKKIMLSAGNVEEGSENEELYRKTLANRSARDDAAFKDFLADCESKFDNDALYLSRFSRPDIGSFLKSAIESGSLSERDMNTAVVSLGIIGAKGYSPAASIIRQRENELGGADSAIITANIMLGQEKYADKLADVFCNKKDYELADIYNTLRGASVVSYNHPSAIVQEALTSRFDELADRRDYRRLECLTSNFQMFWDKKLYHLLSRDVLRRMGVMLIDYAQGDMDVPSGIVISMIETIVHAWNDDVEKVVFTLYQKSPDRKVQEVSFRKLKERKIEAPRVFGGRR